MIPTSSSLLGDFLHYRGIACQVIEILADEPALVLRDCSDHTLIQADQYGHAGNAGYIYRRSAERTP